MNTSNSWYLFWFFLWIPFVNANIDDNAPVEDNAFLSHITLQPDGSLPTDGSACMPVDQDGFARVVFETPAQKESPDGIGIDYVQQGLFLSVLSSKGGSFNPQTTYIPEETSVFYEIESQANAGKTICLHIKEDKIVPSYFEAGARYFGELGALRMLEAAYGGAYNNFLEGYYTSVIPAFTTLHNQIEMGNDFRQLLELHAGMSSSASGFTSVGYLLPGYIAFPEAWKVTPTTLTNLGLAGSFYLFYSAPIGDGLINGLDNGFVTPYIGEWLSPANGTERQLGSILTSEFLRGPFILSALYGGQNYWNIPATADIKAKNSVPNLMVSLTIVSSHGTRQFVRTASEHLLGDSSYLELAEDAILILSMATVDNPSTVTAIAFDENIKGRTNQILMFYHHQSASFKAMDDSINNIVGKMERTLYFGFLLTSAFAMLPAAAPVVTVVLDTAKTIGSFVVPGFLIVMLDRAKRIKPKVSQGLATVGNAVAKVPGVRKISSKTVGSGIPLNPTRSVGNAMGLSVVFNVIGPGFRSFTRCASNILRDLFVPGSTLHETFRSNRLIIIGHTVVTP